MLEKSPAINYTFSSNTSSDLGKYFLGISGNRKKNENHIQVGLAMNIPSS